MNRVRTAAAGVLATWIVAALIAIAVMLLSSCTDGRDPVDPQRDVVRLPCRPDRDTITVTHMWVCVTITVKPR